MPRHSSLRQLCDGLPEPAAPVAILGAVAKRTGRKLLAFDRKLGARFVAGADEAGRGPLAGPLVVAGVLLDLECLRHNRARPLSLLNDSKQLDRATREELYRAVLACAERVSVHVFPPAVIDRDGLHKSNLRGLREALDITVDCKDHVSPSLRRDLLPFAHGQLVAESVPLVRQSALRPAENVVQVRL